MKNIINSGKVLDVLTRYAHHKKDKVFANELNQFLDSGKEEYYFLSEDYYEHRLLRRSGELALVVVSEKEEILKRTNEANHMLKLLTKE